MKGIGLLPFANFDELPTDPTCCCWHQPLVKQEERLTKRMAAQSPLKVHTSVIEVGSSFLRIGIAGEPQPRFIVPVHQFFSPISSSNWAVYQALQGCATHDSPSSSPRRPPTAADCRRHLVVLFNRIFLDYLHVTPKECKVIIIEKLHTPTAVRDGMMTALLKDLQVRIDTHCCTLLYYLLRYLLCPSFNPLVLIVLLHPTLLHVGLFSFHATRHLAAHSCQRNGHRGSNRHGAVRMPGDGDRLRQTRATLLCDSSYWSIHRSPVLLCKTVDLHGATSTEHECRNEPVFCGVYWGAGPRRRPRESDLCGDQRCLVCDARSDAAGVSAGAD